MVDFNLIKKLIQVVKDEGINGLSVQEGEVKIEVRLESSGKITSHIHQPPVPIASHPAVESKKEEAKEDPGLVAITSPMVGTFYRSPSPDSAPYVEAGSKVAAGKTVCIIEAMKLFNEIESEVSGTVEKILVENGQPVEYGQKLILIRKS